MEAATFSTGVSIQWPYQRSAPKNAAIHQGEASNYPFQLPYDASKRSQSDRKLETQAYSACQELAYRFASEKARSAVQTVLHHNNTTCYNHILRFFERYCLRDKPYTTAQSPGRRDVNASVVFPEFHAFPTAAVIAGTDATASDLWVDPVTLTLKRSFPLCLSVPRDVASARKLVEWLAARLANICYAREQEETWLREQVDEFNLLPPDQPPVTGIAAVGRRMTRNYRLKDSEKKKRRLDEQEPDEQDNYSDENYSDESSESSSDDEKQIRRGKKRRLPPVAYGRWTMTKLLKAIQDNSGKIMDRSTEDESRELVAMLGELVQDQLQQALIKVKKVHEKERDVVELSIACFEEVVKWLEDRVVICHDRASSFLNVSSSTLHVSSSEMTLAVVLQSVLQRYVKFLADTRQDGQWKAVAQKLSRHLDAYNLQRDAEASLDRLPTSLASAPRPFLLLCIEQLESFSQHVFSDFLEIWTHFVQQQRSEKSGQSACTLGFVVGVASAASPALRRLDLAVTNRLELQFFSLVDSSKCFNLVLESLVVNASLPLTFSGDVLRTVARRHHRLPSVPRLLLALRFLLFTHLTRCPWSFLCLALDAPSSSGEAPILTAAKVARLPRYHRVSVWLRQHHEYLSHETQEGRATSNSALTAWLVPFNDAQLVDLAERVQVSNSGTNASEQWIEMLDAGLLGIRRRRSLWRLGWLCFQSACSWLDVDLRGVKKNDRDDEEQLFVDPLALALDHRLGEATCFSEVLKRLQSSIRWDVLSMMVLDWQSSFRRFVIMDDAEEKVDAQLSELVLLCKYADRENPPPKMALALRQELVDVFTNCLVSSLLSPPAFTPVDKLVENWSKLTDASVLNERLRFEYHDKLRNLLMNAGIENDTSVDDGSWVHDVGLAFLFYQESASASLSLSEWYESFAAELEDQANLAPDETSKKRKKADSSDSVIKARFVRAYCTLRHWGFLKSDAPRDAEQDIVEKLVFI